MSDGAKQFKLDPNYNDVASRLRDLKEKHPDASMQPLHLERPFWFEELGDNVFLVYAAACYRTPDDPRPGIGIAWEPYPGRTPYTRDSEVMVAETSAWGRAIVAALAADTKKGIASSDEIAARQGEPAASDEAREYTRTLITTLDDTAKAAVKKWLGDKRVPSLTKPGATLTQLNELADYITELTSEPWPVEGEGVSSPLSGVDHRAGMTDPAAPSRPEPAEVPFSPIVAARAHLTGTERQTRNAVARDIAEDKQ